MTLSRRSLVTASSPTHIVSLVVHCRQEAILSAAQTIAALPSVEVPATDERGKLVVLLELPDESELLARITDIESVEGVVSTTLVFHQSEIL